MQLITPDAPGVPVGRSRPRVAVVLGTRPEAIKLAAIAQLLDVDTRLEPVVVTTGQHGEVVKESLALFGVRPDVELIVARDRAGLASLHAQLLASIDRALDEADPSLVVVQGDTATTLAAAQVGFWRRVPVVHVEAGLRTGDLASPFPEEANRRMVSAIASLHLAPTAWAARHLLAEGVSGDRVVVTGNTVIDAMRYAASMRCPYGDDRLESADASERPIVVVTAHRRESWGVPMRRISRAVVTLAAAHPDTTFVVAAHMNSAVRDVLERDLSGVGNIVLAGPVTYGAFARLLARARLVITDSGGIQEEAPAFGVPALVVRDTTERPEGVSAGVAELVGTSVSRIVAKATVLLSDDDAHRRMAVRVNPYGDGHAARRAVEACAWQLGLGSRPDEFVPDTQLQAAGSTAGG